jgi:putative transcriptional regulator
VPIVRKSFEEARRSAEQTDWKRIDAITDEDIARQIAEDPDVAPDMSEVLERGEFVHLHIVDLLGIRTRMGLSREAFAKRFGLDPVELRDWEAMGGVPDEAIRTYLRVIDREPEAVARAVDAMARDENSSARHAAIS